MEEGKDHSLDELLLKSLAEDLHILASKLRTIAWLLNYKQIPKRTLLEHIKKDLEKVIERWPNK